MKHFFKVVLTVILLAFGTLSCQQNPPSQVTFSEPASLREVASVRMNYRYEADVPAPEIRRALVEENNPAVSNDFIQNRSDEFLDRTLTSPDKRYVLAIYHNANDLPLEFRLDMYSADGILVNKITPDTMAVHFPDTIVWSPNSENLAFVAMIRGEQGEKLPSDGTANDASAPTPSPTETPTDAGNSNSELPAAENDDLAVTPSPDPAAAVTRTPPTGVLSFRSEQIYLVAADGDGLKPLTQNEGLIYFYYDWAPDSSALIALAATVREWQFLQERAEGRGEAFVPVGRPRLIEKNGRERRLDDGLTAVRPVWSPDSAKVATAYDTQVRLYDADGAPPTQAAIPLRNSLLLSSQAYDRSQQRELGAVDANVNGNENTNSAPSGPGMLPDPSTLASFNPIVALEWPADDILYFQTAFVKRMLNQADSATSFARWHRLILSVQPRENVVQ